MKNQGDVQKRLPNDYNVICDICGRKRKRSECTLAYGTGDVAIVMSCTDGCSDYRHPLNSPPPIIFDGRPVPDARDEAADNFGNIPTLVPSYFTWGNFPGGSWGALNNGNTDKSFVPIWTWGNFIKG